MIHFLLDNVEQQLEQVDPTMTLLNWLRDCRGLTGTKEGCASGDCGACTVVVAEPLADGLRYRSLNACITPLGSVHGKQLITVEHLAQGDVLHPAQQALVDCHGSQCGFCTPGFVMSLFAHQKNHASPEREALLESLGGNLCRCTGYRPIMAAGVQMYEAADPDQFQEHEPDTIERLEAINRSQPAVAAGPDGARYFAPNNAQGLAELLASHPDARLIAGGTDLMLEHTQGLQRFSTLIHTGRVAELQQLEEVDGELHIGAAVSFSDCAPLLSRHWPDLKELFERLGSLQIRNQGTLGGNIGTASPIGDTPPALLALGARLRLANAAGERELALEDYFLGYRKTALRPGEYIRSIIVPLPQPGDWLQAYKISKRIEDDISAVCGVFRLRFDGDTVSEARIAFGGMAEVPRRAAAAEQAMLGQPWSEAMLASAAACLNRDFSPISDLRASADYRLQVAGNLFRRLYLARQTPAERLRVTHYA